MEAPALRRPVRGGGGGHGHAKADPTKYGDFTPPYPSTAHKVLAHGMGTTMWFWMMYRAYYDLPA